VIRPCDDLGRPGTVYEDPDAGREDPETIDWTDQDIELLFNL
jgi:hypothetical protein